MSSSHSKESETSYENAMHDASLYIISIETAGLA